MGIEMKDRDRGVMNSVESAEGWKCDAMVTAESEQNGRTGGCGAGRRGTVSKLKVCFGHLAEGESIVEGCDGNVATVKDTSPAAVGVESGALVETTERCLTGRCCSYRTRTKAGTCGMLIQS